MKSISTQCMILGHKNFGESDKLIFLYSNDFGKLKVIAKGSRKITSKFTGHLETLNIANISLYFGPKNIILTEVLTIKNFKNIRNDLQKLNKAMIIASLTNQLTYENQQHKDLLQLLKTTIKRLSESEKTTLITYAYLFKLLDIIGIIPDLKETKTTLSQKYLKFFQFIKNQPFSEIEKISITKDEEQHINDLLKRIISDYLEYPLNLFQSI